MDEQGIRLASGTVALGYLVKVYNKNPRPPRRVRSSKTGKYRLKKDPTWFLQLWIEREDGIKERLCFTATTLKRAEYLASVQGEDRIDMSLLERLLDKVGRLVHLRNEDRQENEPEYFYHTWVKDEDGQNLQRLLLTDNMYKTARHIADVNPEDAVPRDFISDLLDGKG